MLHYAHHLTSLFTMIVEGGVIGMDRAGNVAVSLNVTGMGRGYMAADGKAHIAFAAEDTFR